MQGPLTPIDKIRHSIEAQREAVRDSLREHLSRMDPYKFEHLIRDLLREMNFTDCEVTRQHKDGGIDLTASFSIGISAIKTLGQVKRQKAAVGAEALQQFYGAMTARAAREEVHLGLYVTTSSFSSSAVRWVQESSLPLVLVDGTKLVDLLVQHRILVREVELPSPLELVAEEDADLATGDEGSREEQPPGPGEGGRETADGVETARQKLFRWHLVEDDGARFCLRAEYLPDPTRSFEVQGRRVEPAADFRPARTALSRQIAEALIRLFPELDSKLLRERAWSGVYKVYPPEQYRK